MSSVQRVVVTGGSGRLGRNLVAGLAARGHEVVSLDRTPAAQLVGVDGVEQISIDLLDAGATAAVLSDARADALIHLAAIAVPFSAPEEVIMQTNTGLAVSVLGGAVDAGIGRIVAASSPTVLGYGNPSGWLPDRLPLDEQTEPRPWNAYALSKLMIEQTLAMLRHRTGDAVRYAAFRPCYVIAPEEWAGALTQQGHTVRERLADPALSAPALFNYVDARDVADFADILLAALPEIPNGETFFVGADDALATRPLAELLPQYLPGSETLAAGLLGTAPAFSNAKAARLLGWHPQRTWRGELAAVSVDPVAASAAPDRKDVPV